MPLSKGDEREIERVADRLAANLGANLRSLVLFGSAARGDFRSGRSDLDLLIVLEDSTPAAHAAVAEALVDARGVDPMLLGAAELSAAARVFASKFASIQRYHRLLRGLDPFVHRSFDAATARFHCEQGLRNLKLRSTRSFVCYGRDPRRYPRVLAAALPPVFVVLGDLLRLLGHDVPASYAARPPAFTAVLGVDCAILGEILAIRRDDTRRLEREPLETHAALMAILEVAITTLVESPPPPS